MNPTADAAALAEHEARVAALLDPRAWPADAGTVERVERIDTHISTVLLAGTRALKLKKPVRFAFLDFSTRELRLACCDEELRLNRRTAPALYLGRAAVCGTPAWRIEPPAAGASGAPSGAAGSAGTTRFAADRISAADGHADRGDAADRTDCTAAADRADSEPAVWMRRFDNAERLDALAARGALDAPLIDALADAIAALHARAAPAGAGQGTPEVVLRWTRQTVATLRPLALAAADRARVDALADWLERSGRRLTPVFAARHDSGHVREGHGDLHLGNIVRLDGRPVPFDAIEFNTELRLIDTMNDLAFAFMDLLDRGQSRLAWRLLDRALAASGDYGGLALLRYYAVHRALVRASVAALRMQQPHAALPERLRGHTAFAEYLALAERLRDDGAALVVVLCGVSGSGKSTVAARLAEALGGVRVRSDIERKRLHGLAPLARSDGSIYTAEATARTFARLDACVRAAVAARVPVVVDAAALRAAERARPLALARALGARSVLVLADAPADLARARVAQRQRAGNDASEAGVDVLERQLARWEPLTAAEAALAERIDTARPLDAVLVQCDALAARLRTR